MKIAEIQSEVNVPFFKNAPSNVTFFGGDAKVLREVQTEKLGICGDRRLADRLNDALYRSKFSVLGLPIEEQGLDLGDR